MLKDRIKFLANYLWLQSIKNISIHLSAEEARRFNGFDYYYLSMIELLSEPTFSEISDTLGLTKPAITAIVKKLMGMQLVEKRQSKEDLRVYHVYLTEKGRMILEGDMNSYQSISETLEKMLGDSKKMDELENVLEALEKELSNK